MSGPASAAGPDRSDAELLRAHVDGDPDACAGLFPRHRDRLWAVFAARGWGLRDTTFGPGDDNPVEDFSGPPPLPRH